MQSVNYGGIFDCVSLADISFGDSNLSDRTLQILPV
jgi:hypothetical protein